MQIVAMGRSTGSLEIIHALDKQRVVPVSVAGSQAEDTHALRAALNNKQTDYVLDCQGNAKALDYLLACLRNLKAKGIMLLGSLDVPCPRTQVYSWKCVHV